MKGLIIKDILTIKNYLKQYLLVLVLMGGWSVFMKNASFLSMYAILLGGLLVLTTLSTDEMVHFDRYALTMPVNVKTLIKAKYLVLLLFVGSGVAMGACFENLAHMIPVMGVGTGWDWASLCVVAALFLVTYSIVFPIIFKLGVEKARYLYIVVLLALAALILGVLKILGIEKTQFAETGGEGIGFLLVLIGICAAALWISYQVSLQAVKRKEW